MRISLASFGLLTLTLLPVGELLRLPQQGSVCDGNCPNGLECTCLALNRGLRICEPEGFLSPPSYAEAYERQGLTYEPRLPLGAKAMAPPPLVPGVAMDPREQPALKSWAQDVGRGFYSQYLLIHHPEDQLLGVPLLAGPDVSPDYFHRAARTLRHILLDALSSDTLSSLAHTGVRVLIAGPNDGDEDENDENDPWLKHPECSKHFTTGLGGGSPLFPSTGVYQDESQVTLVEELLHTIQYCALSPRSVCMYHKAYQHAMRHHLYTTDGSAEEVDGEPVPTVQADEYLAMAMHRWFGSVDGKNEYKVPGNTADATGRQALQEQDPKAFCILSSIFRADDAWNPDETLEPWASHGNRKMDLSEVQRFCKPMRCHRNSGQDWVDFMDCSGQSFAEAVGIITQFERGASRCIKYHFFQIQSVHFIPSHGPVFSGSLGHPCHKKLRLVQSWLYPHAASVSCIDGYGTIYSSCKWVDDPKFWGRSP